MGTMIFVIAALLIAMAVIAAVAKKLKRKRGTFAKKPVLSKHEQPMFWRLKEAFPEPDFVVLAQVSFGALLTAKGGASRYSFSQKFADFVLTDRAFTVLAIIELDDSSHKGKEANDTARDEMLTTAGYKVLRYKTTPDTNRLRADLRADKVPTDTP